VWEGLLLKSKQPAKDMSDPMWRTFVCRCEEVTQGEVRDLIAQGYTTPEEIKRVTRCSMGLCQGRTCRELLLAEVAKAKGEAVDKVAPTNYRPPAKPISLGGIVEGGAHDLP